MSTEREKKLEERSVAKIERLGGLALKLVILGMMGFPDRTCLLPGRVVFFIEFKRQGKGVIARQQTRWRDWLTGLGFPVYTIDNDEDFDRALATEISAAS